MPRQHPTAGALHQLLGPEPLLRQQMAELASSCLSRTPAAAAVRPWRPSTASTDDTISLVEATWGGEHRGEGELEGDAATGALIYCIRQHTSAYVSIRQHDRGEESWRAMPRQVT
jgi:hypothetical protein